MTKHLPISPSVKSIYDYVQRMRRVQMKSSRQWRENGNIPMADYRSGMVGMCLYILDYIVSLLSKLSIGLPFFLSKLRTHIGLL